VGASGALVRSTSSLLLHRPSERLCTGSSYLIRGLPQTSRMARATRTSTLTAFLLAGSAQTPRTTCSCLPDETARCTTPDRSVAQLTPGFGTTTLLAFGTDHLQAAPKYVTTTTLNMTAC